MYNIKTRSVHKLRQYEREKIFKLIELCKQRNPLPIKAIEKIVQSKVMQRCISQHLIELTPIMIKKKNLMSGKTIEVALGTPLCCDPSSETYWSM